MNTDVNHIYRPRSYLLVGGLEEIGVDGKKDSNNRVFSMGILGAHRKMPIRGLQGDSCVTLEPFLILVHPGFWGVSSRVLPRLPLMGGVRGGCHGEWVVSYEVSELPRIEWEGA